MLCNWETDLSSEREMKIAAANSQKNNFLDRRDRGLQGIHVSGKWDPWLCKETRIDTKC